jgi:hypothetical protein
MAIHALGLFLTAGVTTVLVLGGVVLGVIVDDITIQCKKEKNVSNIELQRKIEIKTKIGKQD